MKLSEYDRQQAIIRNSQYIEDYHRFLKLRKEKGLEIARIIKKLWTQGCHPRIPILDGNPISLDDKEFVKTFKEYLDDLKDRETFRKYFGEYTKVTNRWKLTNLFGPWLTRRGPKDEVSSSPVKVVGKAVDEFVKELKKLNADPLSTMLTTLDFTRLTGLSLSAKKKDLEKIWQREFVVIAGLYLLNLRDRRYLTLEIDLWAKKEDILKEVESHLDLFRKHVKLQGGRERETTCDPWKVYDMHHEEKKSLLSIAKELYGFKENPQYNERAKARYKQVCRASQKACKMIKQVTPTT